MALQCVKAVRPLLMGLVVRACEDGAGESEHSGFMGIHGGGGYEHTSDDLPNYTESFREKIVCSQTSGILFEHDFYFLLLLI